MASQSGDYFHQISNNGMQPQHGGIFDNQIFAGGLLLLVTGALMAYFQQILVAFANLISCVICSHYCAHILQQFSVQLEISKNEGMLMKR